jgi:glutamate synthase domain-containing protein 1
MLNQAIIELMKAEQTYQFRWNKVLYRNPPKARQQEEIIDPEELAKMEAICMDAARKRLQMEKCVRIERAKDAIEIGDFVIIRAAREVDEPFYVAQVSDSVKSFKAWELSNTKMNFLIFQQKRYMFCDLS